ERCKAINHIAAAKDIGKESRFIICSLDESSDIVSISSVPFGPRAPFGKTTEFIKPRSIPRLSDQLHFANDWIFAHSLYDRRVSYRFPIDIASEDRGEIKAESVDVHLLDPI